MFGRIVLCVAAMGLALSSATVAAQSIGKTRGPLDNTRQFSTHFEFSVPRDLETVRSCVLAEVNAAALRDGKPAPKFKIKKSKRKGTLREKYTWKTKSKTTSYTFKDEITFRSGDGWTSVDTDLVYQTSGYVGEKYVPVGGIVDLHSKCGLAPEAPLPADMPRVLGHEADDSNLVLRATSTKSLADMVSCVRVRSANLGGGRMSNTYEADSSGAFFLYYIVRYNNLGSTVRLRYFLKIAPTAIGTELSILAPGVSVTETDPAKLQKHFYAVERISKCEGQFEPRSPVAPA